MTISTSNAQPAATPRAEALAAAEAPAPPAPAGAPRPAAAEVPRTVWSRFIILLLCLAVVMTTLAFGTVHAWALALFQLSAAAVVALWMMDAWRTGALRVSRNPLQLPLAGLIAVGLVQLLPLGAGAGLPAGSEPLLTLDPHATRYALVQLASLTVFFAAALAFLDSPRRLRVVVRTVIIFGFLLALYGLMQHFVNPAAIYFVREPKQAAPFGPYINRHHFAGYMELTLALPLGLIFAGAVARERVPLYAFASGIMGVALVMTNSRGGMLSMMAEVFFLVLVAGAVRRRARGEEPAEGEARGGRVRALAARLGVAFALVLAIFVGVLYFGGEDAVSRLFGTVNAEDPTTGRAHFWRGTWQMIKDRPVLGAGLGAFAAAYTAYDTSSGSYRLEQAHNDYLQILSDAGVVGGLLGLVFVAALFRMAVARMQSHDRFRRGVALGALAGCAGVLVHSFFDFTLHTTANALLFLVLAALATVNGRVEEAETTRRRRRRAGDHERGRIAA
ncbi:MAG TPA: O-antigen ligase family protein [Pyrinomonadaceae bacterium]|nr:O-antigen ligase family protein [Pyrinomonadaceae bacterium]